MNQDEVENVTKALNVVVFACSQAYGGRKVDEALDTIIETLNKFIPYYVRGERGYTELYDEETSIQEDVLAINKLANEIKGKPHE